MIPQGYERYLRQLRRSAATIKSYRNKVQLWLRWLGDRTPTNELLAEYSLTLKLEGKRPRTRRVYRSALISWFEYQNQDLDIAAFDVGRLDPPRRPRATDADVDLLWSAARAMPTHNLRARYLRGRALVVLGLTCYTGLRRAGILSLDVSDLDRSDPERWAIECRVIKGDETHWTPVHRDLRAILEEWLPVREEWCREHAHTSGALLPVDRVRRLAENGIAAIFADLRARAEVTRRITPHVLRHWFASRTAPATSAGMATTQRLLGHSSILTTQRYLSAEAEHMVQAIDALPSFGVSRETRPRSERRDRRERGPRRLTRRPRLG